MTLMFITMTSMANNPKISLTSINLFNGDQQKVDIEILNSSSDIVFQESTKGELLVGKVINFDKAIKGNYTIIIKNGKETYYQNITIG